VNKLTPEKVAEDLPKLERISLKIIRWALTVQNGEELGFECFTPGALAAIAVEKEQAARNVGISPEVVALLLDPETPEQKLQQIEKGPFGLLMECLYALYFDLRIESFAKKSVSTATGISIEELKLLDQYRTEVTAEYIFNHGTMSAQYARYYKRTAGLYLS
jgi:hypothetical protein